MMLWLGIIVLIVAFLLYLLFMPLDLVVNTDENQYYVRIGVLGKAGIEKDEDYLVRIRLRTLFTYFDFHPLKKRSSKKKEKEKAVKNKRTNFKWSYVKTAGRLIRSFEVKRFFLDLDTGNCITNARLYPVFSLLQFQGISCGVNFNHRNTLVLHLQNRPIRIIKSFINP